MTPLRKPAVAVALAIALFALTGCSSSSSSSDTSPEPSGTQSFGGLILPTTSGAPSGGEAKEIAEATYVYGYPLLAMSGTLDQLTNVSSAQDFSAPVNQFNTPSGPVTPSFTTIPAPPVDVLFSNAWLDLSKEPLVFTMPDTGGVYNMMTILSGWTDVIAAPGARTTGTGGGDFLIAGPGWTGATPEGMTLISSPTNLVWIEGSTQYDGPSSQKAVNAIQAGYTLTPLSSWGQPYTPPSNVPTDATVDTSSTPQKQIKEMSAETFLTQLASSMGSNPPSAADEPVVEQMARIGVVPGQEFDWDALDSDIQREISRGISEGDRAVEKYGLNIPGSTKANGWLVNLQEGWGNYGTDYTLRAAAAIAALGAVLPQDDTYFIATGDAKRNNYTITFPADALPPANAAWGIDMYDKELHLVDNPANVYAIGPHLAPVAYNADGSLTVYVQNAQPSTSDQVQNWLPAPDGGFLLVMHIYWPKEPVLNATWSPPALTKVN